jgi:hypothetical protein
MEKKETAAGWTSKAQKKPRAPPPNGPGTEKGKRRGELEDASWINGLCRPGTRPLHPKAGPLGPPSRRHG